MSRKPTGNDLPRILLDGDFAVADELLREDPELINQRTGLILFIAARSGTPQMMEFVCRHNPTPSLSNYAEMAMLCQHVDPAALHIYLAYIWRVKGMAFLRNRLRAKNTALQYAASIGNVAAFEAMLHYAGFNSRTHPKYFDVAIWAFNKNHADIMGFVLQQYFSAFQIAMFLKIRLNHFRNYKMYPRVYALALVKLAFLNQPPDASVDNSYNAQRDMSSIVVADEIDDTCLINWVALEDPLFNQEGPMESLRRVQFETEYDGSNEQKHYILQRYTRKRLSVERRIVMQLVEDD